MDQARSRRRSIRLKGYDYSQAGAYFVTVCSHRRLCLFGDVTDSQMHLNEAGLVIASCWQDIPNHFPAVSLDEWIIMPNHLHGILILTDNGAGHAPPLHATIDPAVAGARHASPLHGASIGTIIGSFKSAAANRINDLRATPGVRVWQRNYYEHVVRDERTLNRIRQYILDNPARWADDPDNPAAFPHR